MNHPNISKNDAAGKKRFWTPVLLFLLVVALITSSILGYVLGRNVGNPPLGQIIDAIILEPEEPDGETALHLAGQVVYSDGKPAAGRTLELHSDPVTTISGSGGAFLFHNVSQGEHTISILNADGSKAAERKINVVRDTSSNNASIKLQDNGEYIVEIAVDIRVLEIEIELDEQSLTIHSAFSYATKDGMVTTPAGTASVKDGVIVTPQGNVFLPDGSMVFPGADKTDATHVILPDDTLLINKPVLREGIDISPEGVVTLPDGTIIEPGGHIKKPDGKEETPGETGVIVTEGTVTPIGEEEPEKPDDPSEPPSGPDRPSATPSENSRPPVSSEEPSKPPEPSKPEPGVPSEPSEPEVPDDGTLSAYGQNADGSYTEWTQHRTIDLFYNRTFGERDKIAPGSSGYYLFQLQNNRRSELSIEVNLSEGKVHLPLMFTLTPLDSHGNKITSKAVTGALNGNGMILSTTIAADSSVTYCLDWVWPFKGNDEKDTTAGSGADLTYTLFMKIRAEEGA